MAEHTNLWQQLFELLITSSSSSDLLADKQIHSVFEQWAQISNILISLSGKHCCFYDIASHKLFFQDSEAADSLGLLAQVENTPDFLLDSRLIHPDSADTFRTFFTNMRNHISQGEMDFLYCHPTSKQEIWFHASYHLIYGVDAPYCGIILYEDITQKRQLELAYESLKNRSEAESTKNVGYYEYNLTDDLFEQVTGVMSTKIPDSWRKSFTSIARYCADYCVHPDDRELYLAEFDRDTLLLRYYKGERSIQVEHRRLRPDGKMFWALGDIQLVFDPYSQKIKAFVMISDIDYKKQEILHLIELSQIDSLTGIYNRRTFILHATELLQSSTKDDFYALLLIDLDHFKKLNDTLGHQFGDTVLAQIGTTLKQLTPAHGFCGRIGGDEFAVFVKCPDGPALAKSLAATICNSLFKDLERNIRLSVSIGVAFCPKNGHDFKSLYACADAALYCVKDGARNGYICYAEDILPI